MHFELLPRLKSPKDLQSLSNSQLQQVAAEIREALCHVVSNRAAHFASNLGVVELCVALHLVFDFSKDRLIWDTGHQIYPHKLVTGRFSEFTTIRQKGGLMGYPNPHESDYDLFMTGHAGSSVSTVLGMKTADDLLFDDGRKSVAVIGDGALPSGIVFEAMNNAAGLKKDLLVILNDNKMGICPRVGGLASYLDKARVAPFYNGLKRDISWLLNKVPVVGESMAETLGQFKDAVKSFLHGGMLFEEMGFRYIGPSASTTSSPCPRTRRAGAERATPSGANPTSRLSFANTPEWLNASIRSMLMPPMTWCTTRQSLQRDSVTLGRLARSGAITTQRPSTGSLRSSGTEPFYPKRASGHHTVAALLLRGEQVRVGSLDEVVRLEHPAL